MVIPYSNWHSSTRTIIICWLFICICEIQSITISSHSSEAPAGCSPDPNPHNAQYFIGYGSLIKADSKRKTAPNSEESIPIIVNGYSREWNANGPTVHLSTTYLGVVPDVNSSFNGVIFRIKTSTDADNQTTNQNISAHHDELINLFRRFDIREDYYCRQKVPIENIIPLVNESMVNDYMFYNSSIGKDIWIYVNRPQFTHPPTANRPIVQSYVDIFITGCLEMKEKFHLANYTDDCIRLTKGWDSGKWVNDRIYPRRPFLYSAKAYLIDKILARNVPEAFNNIQFEG